MHSRCIIRSRLHRQSRDLNRQRVTMDAFRECFLLCSTLVRREPLAWRSLSLPRRSTERDNTSTGLPSKSHNGCACQNSRSASGNCGTIARMHVERLPVRTPCVTLPSALAHEQCTRNTRATHARRSLTRTRAKVVEQNREVGPVGDAVVVEVGDAWFTPRVEQDRQVARADKSVHIDVANALCHRCE